ncbi:MAG: hypothetical protein WBP12_05985 [Candidatus Saccharimonas sp.]
MKRVGLYIACLVATCILLTPHTLAAEPTNNGLLISPPRHNVTVAAAKSISQEFTVANYTNQPLEIILSVQEFTVANLSYEYQIRDAEKPWIHIEQTDLKLESGDSQSLKFSVSPPKNAAPGGKYYLIVASATAKNGDLISTIQVAAPVYITVDGQLNHTSKLENNHGIERLVVLGDRIPFHLDITNTGNIHYLVSVSGKLTGLFVGDNSTSTQHILLPDTTRRFDSSIPVPLLPGIYRATYGYSSEATGNVLVQAWVIYLPPWSIVAVALLVWVAIVSIRIIRKRRATDSRQPQYK